MTTCGKGGTGEFAMGKRWSSDDDDIVLLGRLSQHRLCILKETRTWILLTERSQCLSIGVCNSKIHLFSVGKTTNGRRMSTCNNTSSNQINALCFHPVQQSYLLPD